MGGMVMLARKTQGLRGAFVDRLVRGLNVTERGMCESGPITDA